MRFGSLPAQPAIDSTTGACLFPSSHPPKSSCPLLTASVFRPLRVSRPDASPLRQPSHVLFFPSKTAGRYSLSSRHPPLSSLGLSPCRGRASPSAVPIEGVSGLVPLRLGTSEPPNPFHRVFFPFPCQIAVAMGHRREENGPIWHAKTLFGVVKIWFFHRPPRPRPSWFLTVPSAR